MKSPLGPRTGTSPGLKTITCYVISRNVRNEVRESYRRARSIPELCVVPVPLLKCTK